MGRVTTHVLDAARGRPAANVPIELWTSGPNGRRLLTSTQTNSDGRTNAPLLDGDAVAVGRYELLFRIGAYFLAAGAAVADPPFLDVVPIHFGIADPAGHYHVPLLVTPWSYSTYRGS